MRNADVAVVAAGFGGLATALRLAELGAGAERRRSGANGDRPWLTGS